MGLIKMYSKPKTPKKQQSPISIDFHERDRGLVPVIKIKYHSINDEKLWEIFFRGQYWNTKNQLFERPTNACRNLSVQVNKQSE